MLVEVAVKAPAGDIISHVLVVQLCSDVDAVAAVVLGAETVNVCEDGGGPSAVAAKTSADVLRVRLDPLAVTWRVTFAVCVPEDVVKEIVPLQVVPAVIPD